MRKSKPDHIVAIGGSAGYLSPLVNFFDHTLPDRVSYIILRHIPMDAQSMLIEILQKHSRLKVKEASNNMPVENNTVYILPAGYYMTIRNGILHLQKRTSQSNCAIDIFMESLAHDLKEKSFGIIFSGGGTNGVKGTAFIKKAGGIVLVQDPPSCEHASLPENVIKSGYFNHILLPEEMPRVIQHYITNMETQMRKSA